MYINFPLGQDRNTSGSLHFGVDVCVLTNKTTPVPKVVEMLLVYVEMNGLYTEGIYRKSGSACRARELHQILETSEARGHASQVWLGTRVLEETRSQACDCERERLKARCSFCFSDPEKACLENYPIHTITGLVKRWLRELPDPLMTFNLYNDFLHAAGESSLTRAL